MAEGEPRTPDTEVAVTPTELRAPNLALQPLGYSRAETHRLLERAAVALDVKTSSLQMQISDLKAALDEARRRLAEQLHDHLRSRLAETEDEAGIGAETAPRGERGSE